MFHSWPGWYQVLWGSTWGNNTAAIEWVLFAAGATWITRNFLKKILDRLVAHHIRKPLHEHIDKALAEHKQDMQQTLVDHHEAVMAQVQEIKENING